MSDSREIIPHPEQHSDTPESPEERQRHATEVIPEIIDPDRKPGGDIDKPVDPDLRNYRKAADESD
ncbi:hypothetical protein W97_00364 [Coniosporium apollinis CBS 100218]|uniref:Uncharacterized protein n=1 Tax=Coniosporium apollinis (strain CBS 100218) TaxID=1168221 RepID=R7YGZ8_CONA1|nr:uncharacterized protein W97_00364 [Coniosporium apollinis CBS 100218]EON61153.1 hypothetical protein W97_00364 [Coniosporium apollinis CBS 100218]